MLVSSAPLRHSIPDFQPVVIRMVAAHAAYSKTMGLFASKAYERAIGEFLPADARKEMVAAIKKEEKSK